MSNLAIQKAPEKGAFEFIRLPNQKTVMNIYSYGYSPLYSFMYPSVGPVMCDHMGMVSLFIVKLPLT